MQNSKKNKKNSQKLKKLKIKVGIVVKGKKKRSIRNHLILQSSSIADAQQHCVAVIKQEVQDDDEDEGCENNVDENQKKNKKSPSPSNGGGCDLPSLAAALHVQQSKHFRQQQEEIVNRLHKAVSDNLKLINQGTESCNGSALEHAGVDQSCAAAAANHNLNLNMNLSANSRFHSASTSTAAAVAARNFSNGNTSEMKMCRLNKSKLSNSIVDRAQQLHHHAANVTNDLFSCLLDNDDNNNSNSDLIVNEEGNVDGNYLLPCPLCEIPLEPRVFRQHLDRHYPRDSPICPVLQCGRRFAHPNSVRNHMRLKHTLQWNRMKSMRSSGGPFSSLPY